MAHNNIILRITIIILIIFSNCLINASTPNRQTTRVFTNTLNFICGGKIAFPTNTWITSNSQRIQSDNSIFRSDMMVKWHGSCAKSLVEKRIQYINQKPHLALPSKSLSVSPNNLYAMFSIVYLDKTGNLKIWHYPITNTTNELYPFESKPSDKIETYQGHSEGNLVKYLQTNDYKVIKDMLQKFQQQTEAACSIKTIVVNISSYLDCCINCNINLQQDLPQIINQALDKCSVSIATDSGIPKICVFYSGINAYQDPNFGYTRHEGFELIMDPLDLKDSHNDDFSFYQAPNPYTFNPTNGQMHLLKSFSKMAQNHYRSKL